MANDSDGGQKPAQEKKGTGQGGRNRRWRRRRSPANAGDATGEAQTRQPGQAQPQSQARPKPSSTARPDAGEPPFSGSRENAGNPAKNPQGRTDRRPSRGRGGRRQDGRQNAPGENPQANQPSSTPVSGQGQQGQRRQDRRGQNSGQRQQTGQARPAAGQNPRGNPAQNQQSTGQRDNANPGQREDTGKSQRTNRQDRARAQGAQQTPRQNAPQGVNNRRRASTGSGRGQANNFQVFASSTPLKARGGIKARSSEGGEFGKNWWAKRWLLAMERLMDGARLQRGRRYARMGQVLSMNETGGDVVAKVQGSRPAPYKVIIGVSPFSDEQWEQVLDVLAERAIFAAQLLAGEMPPTIEEAFSAAGVSLFPARGGDLRTECSCPDWANPCKHIAATQYILADRFDEDPFLLFRMRGRTQENILQALRLRRTGSDSAPEPEPQPEEEIGPALEEGIQRFWEMGPGLEAFSVNVQQPQISLPLFKRLGEPDVARGHSLEENLGPALDVISQTALFLAFTDTTREATDNGDSAGENK